jgi:hypothetical protein
MADNPIEKQPDGDAKALLGGFRSQVAEMRRREGIARRGLRLITSGGDEFIAVLDARTRALNAQLAQLRQLEAAGAGYGFQIADLLRTRQQVAALRQEALDIRQSATGSDSKHLDVAFVANTWINRILPLRTLEARRQAEASRVQGRLVLSRIERGLDCNGMLGEATVLAARLIRDAAVDKSSHIGEFWRWMTLDDRNPSIWLYRHDAHDKWKCLFFRIEIARTVHDLDFLLEAYVPIGVGADPSDYTLDASKVYTRSNWRSIDVVGDSYNRSNTYSMNASLTRTQGTAFSRSFGTNSSTNTSVTDTSSENRSRSLSSGRSNSFSWFENHGYNYSGSMHGSSFGNSSGFGRSGAEAFNFGESDTFGDGTSHSTARGSNHGTSESTQNTVSNSVAETIGCGFQLSNGHTLQLEHYNFGIDYSEDASKLLEQWRIGNTDVQRAFNSVILLYESMHRGVTRTIQAAGAGSGFDGGYEVADRLDELGELIFIEPRLMIDADAVPIDAVPVPAAGRKRLPPPR